MRNFGPSPWLAGLFWVFRHKGGGGRNARSRPNLQRTSNPTSTVVPVEPPGITPLQCSWERFSSQGKEMLHRQVMGKILPFWASNDMWRKKGLTILILLPHKNVFRNSEETVSLWHDPLNLEDFLFNFFFLLPMQGRFNYTSDPHSS